MRTRFRVGMYRAKEIVRGCNRLLRMAPFAAALLPASLDFPAAAAETWRLEAWERTLDFTSPSRPL